MKRVKKKRIRHKDKEIIQKEKDQNKFKNITTYIKHIIIPDLYKIVQH